MDLGREHTCHFFLIIEGNGRVADDENATVDIAGPALVWFPQSSGRQFQLLAGGRGATLAATADFVSRTVGAMAVGVQLRAILDAPLVLSADKIGTQMEELSVSFSALAREAGEQRAGGQEMIAAHLTVIFMHLWRATIQPGARGAARAANLPTAQRFQQLLELHYHEDMKVDDYADMLGVTRSHLHHACLRNLGQTPLAVIHGRMIDEARQRLWHTTLPIEQIAYSLGFRDPGYFSRFFKRLTGETPGAFRQRITIEDEPASASFAAWP